MSGEDSEVVVGQWIEAYNDRDRWAEAAARAPDFVAHVPGASGPLDSEAWTHFIGAFAAAFPDLRLTVEDYPVRGGQGCGPCGVPWYLPR